MSVTAAAGFRAAGVTAGLKASGLPDVALVVNDGPDFAAAGVFTTNRIQAAPVLWSRQVLASGRLRAVILNSGGANACTGPRGFGDTHRTAEHVAEILACGAGEVAVASTGLIGEFLPMDKLLFGVDAAVEALTATAGADAAEAIRTTDTFAKQALARQRCRLHRRRHDQGRRACSPRAWRRCSASLTTDAVADAATLDTALREATRQTLDRVDTDGCMSTNDTVLLLASGASGVRARPPSSSPPCTDVLADLSRQLIADAEGATKRVTIEVLNAATEDEAVEVGRGRRPFATCSSARCSATTQLGPGAGRRRHHPGGVRSADPRRHHQRRHDLP